MKQMIAQAKHDIQICFQTRIGLVNDRKASVKFVATIHHMFPGSDVVMTSTQARLHSGALICRGDIVCLAKAYGDVCAEIWFHLEIDSNPPISFVTIHRADRVDAERHGCRYTRCLQKDNPDVVPVADIQCPTIARFSDDNITALWPIEWARLV